MDGFEALVAELLEADGYWIHRCHKVNLTKKDKVDIGRPSSPRWEIDLLAYRATDNLVLAVECKSFLDSPGVRLADLQGGPSANRYKLFTDSQLRRIVFRRLAAELAKSGLCPAKPTVQLALAAGHVQGDPAALRAYFAARKWPLFDPDWISDRLTATAGHGYTDSVAVIAAKILLRKAQARRGGRKG